MRGKPVINKRQNCGKIAANTRLMLGVICLENFAAKFGKDLRQCRGKNSTSCGKLAAKIRGKLKCHFPRLCRDFAANLVELLQIIFRGKSRGKLTNTF
jgi:hypothetical protein